MSPRVLRFFLNLWPPYLGAGVRVRLLAGDYREALVEMRLGWTNRNYYGDHFGGSLYSMTDPFFTLMLIHILGPAYKVTHAAGSIRYLAPARGKVRARFRITEEQISAIRAATDGGEKHLPQLSADISDEAGRTVARVTHTLYVRKKRPA